MRTAVPDYAAGTILVVTIFTGLHTIPRFFRIVKRVHPLFYLTEELAFEERQVPSDIDRFDTHRRPIPNRVTNKCILRWYERFAAFSDQPPSIAVRSAPYRPRTWHSYTF